VTGPVPKFVRRHRVAQKLREAADLLATDGWVQGVPEDDQGRHCAAGAIEAVTGDGTGKNFAVSGTAMVAVADHLGIRITDWNDQPGRTAEEVIAVLRETAAEQDARAATALAAWNDEHQLTLEEVGEVIAALEQVSRPAGELP
jgi:ATP:corrinoid adenosyltransferase